MTSAPHHSAQDGKPNDDRKQRPEKRRVFAIALATAVLLLAAAVTIAWLTSPSGGKLDARVNAHLRRTGGSPIALDRIAPILRQAVVATEDERFYRHHGIDLLRVLRALPYDLTHLSLAQGASTITEQLAKIIYLGGNDHTPWRKLEDAAVALKLESRYSKEHLLAAYLSSVYFGHGAYGVSAASGRYFGIPPSRLTLAQATLLAGLIQAPSADDPVRRPAAARARQIAVLRSMVTDGLVTSGEAATALARPLPLHDARPLSPLRGVDFTPGSAFIWWELGVGMTALAAGVVGLVSARRLQNVSAASRLALSIAEAAIAVLGAAIAIRSFRSV